MRLSRLPLAAAALTAAAALAVPASAVAKLPSFASGSFTATVGFGGAKLGQTRAAATRAWGGGSRAQCTDYGCAYQDARRPQLGSANIVFEDGKRGRVSKLVIVAGRDPRSGKLLFGMPLAAVTGSKGIHLGSSERAVRAAYPKAKGAPGETTYIVFRDRKGNQAYFSFERNRLFQIIIEDRRLRG